MVLVYERPCTTSFRCCVGEGCQFSTRKIYQYLPSLDGKRSRLEYFQAIVVGTTNSSLFLWRRERRLRRCRKQRRSISIGTRKKWECQPYHRRIRTRSRCLRYLVFLLVVAHKCL